MKSILIVDVQNGYLGKQHNLFLANLNSYLQQNKFDFVIYTRFVTTHEGKSYKNIRWFGLYDKEEKKLAIKKLPGSVMFNKKCHGLTPAILKYITENDINEIELCGIDNQGNISLIADTLSHNGIKVHLLNSMIAKSDLQLAKLPDEYSLYLITSLFGFYVGDIMANNKTQFSDETILSFAILQWLLNGEHTASKLQQVIVHYHKLFPDKYDIYSPGLEKWLDNNCTEFRECDDFEGVKVSTPIAFYSGSLTQIDALLEECHSFTHDSKESLESAKIVCYTIWLMRANIRKNNLIKKLSAFFNYEFSNDLQKVKAEFEQNPSSINFARLAVCIFINSTNFEEALNKALSIENYKQEFACVVGAMAESYFKNIPVHLVVSCRKLLPNKFKKLLIEYSKTHNPATFL